MNVVLGTNAEVLVGPQVEEKIKEIIREAVGPQIDLNVAKFYLVTADCIKSRKHKGFRAGAYLCASNHCGSFNTDTALSSILKLEIYKSLCYLSPKTMLESLSTR